MLNLNLNLNFDFKFKIQFECPKKFQSNFFGIHDVNFRQKIIQLIWFDSKLKIDFPTFWVSVSWKVPKLQMEKRFQALILFSINMPGRVKNLPNLSTITLSTSSSNLRVLKLAHFFNILNPWSGSLALSVTTGNIYNRLFSCFRWKKKYLIPTLKRRSQREPLLRVRRSKMTGPYSLFINYRLSFINLFVIGKVPSRVLLYYLQYYLHRQFSINSINGRCCRTSTSTSLHHGLCINFK